MSKAGSLLASEGMAGGDEAAVNERGNRVVGTQMTAVAKIAKKDAAQVSESAAIFSLLERAASDPTQPVERLEQVFALYQKIEAETARKAFMAAFVSAQKAMKAIVKDGYNPQTKSKYATHAKLDAVLRPIYSAHGFAITFDTEDSPLPEHVRVVGVLMHESGHERRYQRDMPADGKGAKGGDVMTKTHAAGAAGSYGARYLLIGMWNLNLLDKDTDGSRSEDQGVITPEQVEELSMLITETGTDIHKFLAIGNVESLSDIPARDFVKAKAMLLAKKKQVSK